MPRHLNRNLDRRLNRHPTRMLGGLRRPPPPNWLAIACRSLNQCVRIARRMARREPHIFGPQASAYFLKTLEMEKSRAESAQALRRVYGDTPAVGTSTVWQDRYPELVSHLVKESQLKRR